LRLLLQSKIHIIIDHSRFQPGRGWRHSSSETNRPSSIDAVADHPYLSLINTLITLLPPRPASTSSV
jgi:hypothetical protein